MDEAGGLLLYGGEDAEVVVPDYVTSIRRYAFLNCDHVTSVTLPGTLVAIERQAFMNCSALERITIPGSVEDVSDSAFAGCTALSAIDVAEDNARYLSRTAWCSRATARRTS